MREEYVKLIESLDRTISMLRKQWLGSHSSQKEEIFSRIDESLEERFRLMQSRDSAETPV